MSLLAEFARLRRATPMLPAEVAAVKQERVEEEKRKLAERPPVTISVSTVPIDLEVGQETPITNDAGTSVAVSVTGAVVPSPLVPRSITAELDQMRDKVPAVLPNAPGKSSFPADGKKRKRVVEKGKREEKKSNAGKKTLPAPGDVIFSGKNLPPKKLSLKVPLTDASVAVAKNKVLAPSAVGIKEKTSAPSAVGAKDKVSAPSAVGAKDKASTSSVVGTKDKASACMATQEIISPDLLPFAERLEGEESEYFRAVNSALQLENDGSAKDKARDASKARWMSEQDLSVERRFSKMESIIGVLMSDVMLLKSGYFSAGGKGEGYLGGDESEALREQFRRGRRADK